MNYKSVRHTYECTYVMYVLKYLNLLVNFCSSYPLLFYVEFIYLNEIEIKMLLLFENTDLCIFLSARHGITLLFYANDPTNLNF